MSLDHTFCIAPMMQCTDLHDRFLMRLITKKAFLYTEMISSGAIIHNKNYHSLLYNNEIDSPVALQLGGSNPEDLAKCIDIINEYGYDEINLNVGCPSKRVQKGSFGACLMLDPKLITKCLRSMTEASSTPISVKCRIGVDEHDDYDFLKTFVEAVAKANVKIIIVHARKAYLSGLSPRQNRSIPELKYEVVYKLKEDFPDMQIIINGGINDISSAKIHLKYTDGVMMGRMAYDNPIILSEVDSVFYDEPLKTLSKKNILKEYFKFIERSPTKHIPLSQSLRHLYGLNRGCVGAKKFRQEINNLIIKKDLNNSLDNLSRFLN